MGNQPTQRRLAAVLVADVAGYTRLMELDTDGTVAAWQAARQEVIKPTVADHSGKIVKLTGDGFLVEFSTVQDAVNCAIAMQRGLASSSLDFRMGVNLGDIVDDGEDIHGEGINVAARLEGLADPGGICISGDVYNQVRNRVDAIFEDMGQQEVKNVSQPVQAYAVHLDSPAAPSASAAPAISDKHSIAVLPFDNLSGDPDQEYFADGITEDIITALSNVRAFTVLARNSTFVYKGKSVDAKEIGRELNVHYLLEGSVRRAGDRVRVTAQLIDTTTGDHIWADRYDGMLDNIFDLQDRITSTIVGTIEPELVRAEGSRIREKRPENMDAYDYLLRGLAYMYKLTPEDTREALACFEKSIELDPNYGRAHAYASWCYRRHVQQSGLTLSEENRRKAVELAHKSLRLDRNDPFVLVYAGATIAHIERNFDEALALADRAISLNPASHRFWNTKAHMHALKGNTAEAIEAAERAISLSPNNPGIWVAYLSIAEAHLQELRFEEAVGFARRALRHNEILAPAHHIIAAVSAHLGRDAEAQQALRAALEINPDLTIGNFRDLYPVAQFKNLDAYLDGLRKAGLPE